MFTKKDTEITELKIEVLRLENENEFNKAKSNRFERQLKETTDGVYIDENTKLKKMLVEKENEVGRCRGEIEMLDKKISYLEKFNEELQSLPNVKKTIDSLTSLNFNGLDEFERIAKILSGNQIANKLDILINGNKV